MPCRVIEMVGKEIAEPLAGEFRIVMKNRISVSRCATPC